MARIITIIIMSFIFFLQACSVNKQQANSSAETLSLPSSFEGDIVYSMKFESTDFPPKMAKEYMGDSIVYTYKENHFKNVMNGSLETTFLYNGGDTIFFPMKGAKGVGIEFASKKPCEVVNYKIEKNVGNILNLSCDLLTINTDQGYIKYYFNKKYYLSPDHFNNLDYGLIGFCVEKTNAIPLRMITKEKGTFVDIRAAHIKKYKVDWAQFDVPKLPRLYKPWEKWKNSDK